MLFNDRTSYLAAVKDWQAKYFAQMKIIRQAKLDRREIQRAFSRFQNEHGQYWKIENKETRTEWMKRYTAFMGSYQPIAFAIQGLNDLVQERQAGREEANRQYMAAQDLKSMV
jgi:hypothetical protein